MWFGATRLIPHTVMEFQIYIRVYHLEVKLINSIH